jgi:hypothetical protein
MNPARHDRLAELARNLVTEDRFGRVMDAADVALGDTVEFDAIPAAAVPMGYIQGLAKVPDNTWSHELPYHGE